MGFREPQTPGIGLTGQFTLAEYNLLLGLANLNVQQGDIFYVDGTLNINRLPASAAGDVLQTNGVGANPSWVAPGASTPTFSRIFMMMGA